MATGIGHVLLLPVLLACPLLVSSSFQHTTIPWVDIDCHQLLERFAEAASQMTRCVLRHSRPVRLCERCLGEHLRAQEAFRNISGLPKGDPCKADLLRGDRLELVQAGYGFVRDTLWQSANCDDCYTVNSSRMVLRTGVAHLAVQYNRTFYCLTQFGGQKSDPCKRCRDDYLTLASLYNNLTKGNKAICMDIVDMMNSTWQQWDGQLGCRAVEAPDRWWYFLVAPLILALPLFFYFCLRRSVERQESIVMQQRRLAEQLAAMARSYSRRDS